MHHALKKLFVLFTYEPSVPVCTEVDLQVLLPYQPLDLRCFPLELCSWNKPPVIYFSWGQISVVNCAQSSFSG